jgi:ATP-dependent DNA helicase RecG
LQNFPNNSLNFVKKLSMTQAELELLMQHTESERLEKTISLTNTEKFSEAVCAFANDMGNQRQPGYLLVGVHDDNTLAGMHISDEFLRSLSDLRSAGNILPQPALTVEKVVMPGGEVAIVAVQPSDLPPVRYKGKVYIRVGPRRAIANEQEERLLNERRTATALTFDVQPCQEALLSDLTPGLFETYRIRAVDEETIAANHRTLEAQMASLRLFSNRFNCPTNAGVVLFGRKPRYFFPGHYIQFLLFAGTNMTDLPIDQAEIEGDLSSMIREMELRIRTVSTNALKQVDGWREQVVPEYPEWALRELLLNALVHRDYSSTTPARFYVFADRIEIANPGGLFGGSSPENFPTVNAYRNPVLAEAVKTLGFINRFGYGVLRAQTLLSNNGNPPPDFSFSSVGVKVTV